MEPRVNYFLAGIFVLVLGAAMVAGLLWLSVGTSTRDYDKYYVYMTESVAGLNTDAPVRGSMWAESSISGSIRKIQNVSA